MSKSASSIEINGQRYDAKTGHAVEARPATHKRASIDGVVNHKPAATTVLATPRIKPTLTNTPISTNKLMDMKAPARRPRTAAAAASGHSPQTAHTLMRHVVQKPNPSLKRQHAAQGHTGSLVAKPALTITPKKSASVVPSERMSRAQTVTKSPKISKFARSTSPVIALTAPLVIKQPQLVPTTSKPLDIFEQALQRATSHEQAPVLQHKHPKRQSFLSKRAVSLSATAISVLLLVGFIGFENRSNITLKMAAGKAGFSANMPGYKPSGFSLGRLSYSAGNVALNFHSNSDGRAFAITEKPSAWDSATLRDTFVASADSHFQTVNVGGRTVFLYGKNNAAWVNGGILYQVDTAGALSDKQLSELAASL